MGTGEILLGVGGGVGLAISLNIELPHAAETGLSYGRVGHSDLSATILFTCTLPYLNSTRICSSHLRRSSGDSG